MPLNPSIQKIIPTTQPGVIASYDFIDVTSGTGVVIFYAGTTGADAGSGFVSGGILATNAFYSQNVMTTGQVAGQHNDFTLRHDVDFDVKFLLPQNIEGTAIVNIPLGSQTNNDAGTAAGVVRALVRKWTGSAEINIASASGAILNKTAGAGNYAYDMDCIPLTIPLTHFGAGDTLRLTIEHYYRQSDSSSDLDWFFGHDPKGRATSSGEDNTFGTEPSILTFQVPFKLNLG